MVFGNGQRAICRRRTAGDNRNVLIVARSSGPSSSNLSPIPPQLHTNGRLSMRRVARYEVGQLRMEMDNGVSDSWMLAEMAIPLMISPLIS